MIKSIQDNTETGTWDDATLTAMSEDVLEKVFRSVKKEMVTDYSLNGEVVQQNKVTSSGGMMLPPGAEIEETK